jgi:hypothetical protein
VAGRGATIPCGLSIDETAEALGVSSATVEREWALAKAWLNRRLSSHA